MPTTRPTYAGRYRNPAAMGSLPADPVDPAHQIGPGGVLVHDQRTNATHGERTGVPPALESDVAADARGWSARAGYVPDAPLDRTPIDHRQGVPSTGQATEHRADQITNAARSRDLGAVRRRSYGPPVMRGVTERYALERRQILPISDGSSAQLRFGATGRPENTTDSTFGHDIFRWVDRKFPMRWRRADMRPVAVGTAATVGDSPPLRDANQYTSPFSLLGNAKVRNMMSPMIRRVPRPFDETVIVDGTDGAAAPDEYQSWGL